MKTTVDLPDTLLAEAKERARRDGTTLRALLADGLRRVLDEPEPSGPGFSSPVFEGGAGVRPGVDLTDWSQIRSLIYEDDGSAA